MTQIRELIAVRSFNPRLCQEIDYDLLIGTIGYESRARFFFETHRPTARFKVACAFSHQQSHAFDKNREWYSENGFDCEILKDDQFEAWIAESILRLGDKPCRICIDISSISRFRLAAIVASLHTSGLSPNLTVDFTYSLSSFVSPAENAEPIEYAGPVLPFFAGYSDKPDLPTVAMIGLGYEPDRAVGAYEYLEAAAVQVFLPIGEDPRFKDEVERANRTLLGRLPAERIQPYHVASPVHAFGLLESITFGGTRQGRPILLPFGPKVFALNCLLVASIHRDVGVWRISSGTSGDAIDRTASGMVVGLTAEFESRI